MEREEAPNVRLMYGREGRRRLNFFIGLKLVAHVLTEGQVAMEEQRKQADERAKQALDKKPIADAANDDSGTREMPALSVKDLERMLDESKE